MTHLARAHRPTAFFPTRSHRHQFLLADSSKVEYDNIFDLVLTSPPFFHPERQDSKHGYAPTTDLDQYVRYVSTILLRVAKALKNGGLICIVKTDVFHKGSLIPVGFRLVDECTRRGLILRGHWIWQRLRYRSLYSPSFANVFLFGTNIHSRST